MKINGLNNCSEEDVLSALDRVEKEEKEFAILE